VLQLRDDGVIDDIVLRRIQARYDVEEVRLTPSSHPRSNVRRTPRRPPPWLGAPEPGPGRRVRPFHGPRRVGSPFRPCHKAAPSRCVVSGRPRRARGSRPAAAGAAIGTRSGRRSHGWADSNSPRTLAAPSAAHRASSRWSALVRVPPRKDGDEPRVALLRQDHVPTVRARHSVAVNTPTTSAATATTARPPSR
jgi:hypothetical protein